MFLKELKIKGIDKFYFYKVLIENIYFSNNYMLFSQKIN